MQGSAQRMAQSTSTRRTEGAQRRRFPVLLPIIVAAGIAVACGDPEVEGSASDATGLPTATSAASSDASTTGDETSGEPSTSASASASGSSSATAATATSETGATCGGEASLTFLSPGDAAENPVTIATTAEGPIVRVEYLAEGVFPLGESTDAEGEFTIEAIFTTLGPRTIEATGYDACGEPLATASRVTVVSEGMTTGEDTDDTGDTGDTGESMLGDDVCFQGPSKAWDVCFPLILPGMVDGYEYPPPLDADPNYRAPLAFIDLGGVDLGVALAANFLFNEVATAEFGPYVVVQPRSIEHLQNMRDALGALGIDSGYRSPKHNANLGGSTWSRHLYGDAYDIVPQASTLQALFDRCGSEGATFRQLYDGHVHCDWRGEPVDERFFGPASGPLPPEDPWLAPWLDATIVADGDGYLAPAIGWDEGEPLRSWRALDAEGALVAEGQGPRFEAPAEAARVEVIVGGVLERAIDR